MADPTIERAVQLGFLEDKESQPARRALEGAADDASTKLAEERAAEVTAKLPELIQGWTAEGKTLVEHELEQYWKGQGGIFIRIFIGRVAAEAKSKGLGVKYSTKCRPKRIHLGKVEQEEERPYLWISWRHIIPIEI